MTRSDYVQTFLYNIELSHHTCCTLLNGWITNDSKRIFQIIRKTSRGLNLACWFKCKIPKQISSRAHAWALLFYSVQISTGRPLINWVSVKLLLSIADDKQVEGKLFSIITNISILVVPTVSGIHLILFFYSTILSSIRI